MEVIDGGQFSEANGLKGSRKSRPEKNGQSLTQRTAGASTRKRAARLVELLIVGKIYIRILLK